MTSSQAMEIIIFKKMTNFVVEIIFIDRRS